MAIGINRVALFRPKGPAVNRPGREAGRRLNSNTERRRRGTLEVSIKKHMEGHHRILAGACVAPSALISALQFNPGLTAGPIYCRPFGPQEILPTLLEQYGREYQADGGVRRSLYTKRPSTRTPDTCV